jgi:hypothetical protein
MKNLRGLFTIVKESKGNFGEKRIVWIEPNLDYTIVDSNVIPPEGTDVERIGIDSLTHFQSARELKCAIKKYMETGNESYLIED